MMDINSTKKLIETLITDVDRIKKVIRDRGQQKAETASEYDKAMALTLIGLKNGLDFTLDGAVIKTPPASTSDKIARGICFKEKLDMDVAESEYKSAIVNLHATESQLSAAQSIFRHID